MHFPIALEGCNMEFTQVAFFTPAPLMANEDCVLAVEITFHAEGFHLSLSSCLKLTLHRSCSSSQPTGMRTATMQPFHNISHCPVGGTFTLPSCFLTNCDMSVDSVLQLWTLEQSVLGCGTKTRTNATLEQLVAWAQEKEPHEPVPSLVWRTELALVYAKNYLVYEKSVAGLVRALGFHCSDIVSVPCKLEFGVAPLRISRRRSKPGTDYTRSYKAIDISFGILWTWDPVKRSTRGLMYGSTAGEGGIGLGKLYHVLQGLQRHPNIRANPLLLGILLLDAEYHVMCRIVKQQNLRLVGVELATGRHDYTDGSREVDISTLDLAELSCEACATATAVSRCALSMQTIMKFAKFIVAEFESFTQSTHGNRLEYTGLSSNLKASEAHLSNYLRTWQIQASSLLDHAQSLQWRAEIIVQTVFTMTTQRDQEISIGIARDSKTLAHQAIRDSTSMKSIAAVTMFFLPGTFVAVSHTTQLSLSEVKLTDLSMQIVTLRYANVFMAFRSRRTCEWKLLDILGGYFAVDHNRRWHLAGLDEQTRCAALHS